MRTTRLVLILCALALVTRCQIEVTPADADQLDKEISQIQARLNSQYRLQMRMKPLMSGQLGAATFECSGGKNPAKMSKTEYLEAFVAGPCTPVMVMAGIAESKLMIQIECEILRAQSQDVFSTCGWSTCKEGFFSNSPKKEYKIWMPDLISPFTLIDPFTEKYQKCFSALFGLKLTADGNAVRANPPSGVMIIPYGMTEETRKDSRCGFDGISSILPLNYRLNPLKWKAYDILRADLENNGYMIGLTAQALPYDWRLPMDDNTVAKKFEKIIDAMYMFTGKKVSIIAHSFGNLNTLNNLWKMSVQKRQERVQRYFALAPPFLGAPTTAAMMMGGSSSYHFKGMGLNFDSFKKTLGSFPAAFDLMPRNTWQLFQSAPWMTSIKNKIVEESGSGEKEPLNPEDDIVSKIFPKHTETCYTNEWKSRTSKCQSGIAEYYTLGSVAGEKMNTENLADIFAKYSFNSYAGDMFRQSHTQQFDEMVNPGVETVIMYSNLLSTGNDFVYNNDPKPQSTKTGVSFIEPDSIQYDLGDTSVLTTSSLIPGIKWAYEFDRQTVSFAKPVVFVETCSNFNRKDRVFQEGSKVTSNERQGLKCMCNSRGSESDCDHLGMITDSNLVDYVIRSLKDNQVSNSQARISTSEAQLANFVSSCAMLNN
jgi:lecithin-cholesterol acyltransferase